MGQVFSRNPVTVSPQTHHFQASIQSGTLVYVALSNQSNKISPITESRRIDNNLFFGFNVAYAEIRVDNRIGTGNFGIVYKAQYKGKHIALKQLLNDQQGHKTMDDFEKTHQNIVHFLGAVLEPPRFCILMELCAGSVVDLLKLAQGRKFNITWGLTLDIALDCAKACAYLHGLDPIGENLLLTEQFKCKLSDFGLSRSLERNSNAQTMCGTPRWLAPEVFRGEDYTEKVDVYSYGIVLWELFCFKKPYLDQDPINLAYLVAHEELRPPLCEHIPDILHRLMETCWHASPMKRPSFPSVIQLIEEAKAVVTLNLPIDLSRPYADACTAYKKHSRHPHRHYGLTSGQL
ncbi:TPA: hypothetical protein N0F65_003932 [Lagenidium giganteum]|uniref:Protein kinase domain-containing protein n=1 Tax=Lagenidium giganteum TaxID=4803 RepID=A0AAV2ZCE2_9STRA|nr:TPA: hypothetical protein N0F65_003932 [Lagenidium giganteum]